MARFSKPNKERPLIRPVTELDASLSLLQAQLKYIWESEELHRVMGHADLIKRHTVRSSREMQKRAANLSKIPQSGRDFRS